MPLHRSRGGTLSQRRTGSFQADAGDASAVVLRHGTDITLAGYGMEINDLLEAAARLEEAGIQAEVVSGISLHHLRQNC